MQYILSEEEYQELNRKRSYEVQLSKSKLQKLCTKIADTMPVNWGWEGPGPDPKPWGCILTQKREWYCDTCPVQDICPYDHKHWSK
jgi:hypothetical protein